MTQLDKICSIGFGELMSAIIDGNIWITASIPSGMEVTIAVRELRYKKPYLVEE